MTSFTGIDFSEYALHWVAGAVFAGPRLSRTIAVTTEVKVIAYKALVTISREPSLPASITADT